MKILEPASEIFRYYEERISSKGGRTCYRMSAETRRTSSASITVGRDKSGTKVLQPAEEIVRCYEERIYSLKGVKGAIEERIRSIESTSVNGPLHVRKDEKVVEEKIVIKVEKELQVDEKEHNLKGDIDGGKISAAGMEDLHKEIESVRVDRLDRRVSELEKENEMLRKERDLRVGDLRRLCSEVDHFLDVVESFLDEPLCCRRNGGKGGAGASQDTSTVRRASSNSSVKNLTMTMKTLKSSTDKRKRPEPERNGIRKPIKGSIYRDKTPVASHATGTASSSLKKMLMMGSSRKRKRPDAERREVIVRKLVLPPGLLPWRP